MDIYEALKADHDQLKLRLDQLVAASERDAGTKQLLQEIYDLLIPHARAEEAVFYNSLRGIDLTKDLVKESYKEHIEAESLLQTLRGLEVVNIEWMGAARKLRDAVLHHIAQEETQIFFQARKVLFETEAQQMAPAFEQLKQHALEQSDMKNTLGLIANMMPKRFAERTRSFDVSHPS